MTDLPSLTALSNLLCASLTEDPYGVASRDIPKVIEAWILYLQSLEDVQKDFTEQSRSASAEARDELLGEVDRTIAPVQGALKDAVRAVLAEFAPYAAEFKFPPAIAQKLQVLVDWN